MTIKKILAVGALLVMANMAFAGKIAIFNHESAMMGTKQAAQAIEKLKANAEYNQMMTQIESLQADLKGLAKEAETNGMTWSQEKMAEHRKKMEYVQADLQLAAKKIQGENAAVINKLAQEFQPKLKAVLDEIMKADGIDVILRPQAVYTVMPALDITAKVTAALDKAK
ncbi:OmpH family outer membrane protein [Teredinibacter haidensis]|uniref:OmpH family outer membrane protein n=1 Tax=Teredinibacter haidensis TaxID=2731755 RepID=UPI0009491DCD|nr:OmpH family outer membrane protein [Teredinibacter haidensis]